MTKRAVVVMLALGTIMAAGCGRSGSAAPSVATSTTQPAASTTTQPAATTTQLAPRTGATTTTPAAAAGTVRLTEKDDGTTVRAVKGATIIVVLSSTYWMFPAAPTPPGVLSPVGAVVTSPGRMGSCIPGSGCGTVTATFRAVGAGRAQITASRTTCGEALACTGKAGSYSVQVTVT